MPHDDQGLAGAGSRRALTALAAVAACLWVLLLVVFVNHLRSPDISRGVAFESVHRALSGLSLYPAPSGEFVALDYNPLVYYLDTGAALLFGLTPGALKAVSMAATILAGAIVYLAVRSATGSGLWGFIASGLFAGAYRAFDCFFDYANPDACMLFTALAGLYLIQRGGGTPTLVAALALLSASFWCKQQGALLAIGGVLYVTWRLGLRRAAPAWITAVLLGPIAYFVAGPRLFGEYFVYYTYEVPHAYSNLRVRGFLHAGVYFLMHWAILLAVSAWAIWRAARRRDKATVWTFTFPFALTVGLLGAMDFSEHNVYMPAATWSIILGVTALARVARDAAASRAARLVPVALGMAFLVNLYDPREVMVPPRAWDDYRSLVAQLRGLDGLVYMPSVAQMPSGVRLPMPVHWVPLQDLVRGRGHKVDRDPIARSVLRDLIEPSGPAHILTDWPLADEPLFAFLAPHYRLVEDLGDRYRSLRSRPGYYSGRTWPRYLYTWNGDAPATPPAATAPNGVAGTEQAAGS